MKKLSVLVLFFFLAELLPAASVYAGSRDSLSEVVMDGLYGGLAGTLIGAATLAFVDKASEHEDHIKIGAGAGIILGSIYGTVRVSRALVEIKDGTIVAHTPTILPGASLQRGGLLWNVNLFQITF